MGTKYNGTASEKLALNTFIRFARAYHSVAGSINLHLKEAGLTATQFGVLEALLHLGPMSQQQLGDKLLKSGGNITMVIDNLSKRGLVERKKLKKDRRFYSIKLTISGQQLIASMFPGHVKHIYDRLRCLSPAEQSQLGELCKKLGLNTKY
jgi:MarR family 2-MHQ and catechol resistance regulon transcriptional repressor